MQKSHAVILACNCCNNFLQHILLCKKKKDTYVIRCFLSDKIFSLIAFSLKENNVCHSNKGTDSYASACVLFEMRHQKYDERTQ